MPKQHSVTCLVQLLQLAGLRVVGGIGLSFTGYSYSCSLYYSWQLCVLLACIYIKHPVLQSSSSCLSLLVLSQLLHHFLPYLVGSLLLATNGHHSASIQSDVFWLTMSMCMASTKLNATCIGCSVHDHV